MPRFTLTCLAAGALFSIGNLAIADDVELADKLKGSWLGFWRAGERVGRLSASITDSSENQLQGHTIWYGLSTTEMKLPFDKAEIRNGTLLIYHQQGIGLEGQIARSAKAIKGSWSSAAGGGSFELKKKSH